MVRASIVGADTTVALSECSAHVWWIQSGCFFLVSMNWNETEQ